MSPNNIKAGAYLLLTNEEQAIMRDNKRGIIRTIEVLNDYHDVGSDYIDRITHVYVQYHDNAMEFPVPGSFEGVWEEIEISTYHKKQLEGARYGLFDYN